MASTAPTPTPAANANLKDAARRRSYFSDILRAGCPMHPTRCILFLPFQPPQGRCTARLRAYAAMRAPTRQPQAPQSRAERHLGGIAEGARIVADQHLVGVEGACRARLTVLSVVARVALADCSSPPPHPKTHGHGHGHAYVSTLQRGKHENTPAGTCVSIVVQNVCVCVCKRASVCLNACRGSK